MNKGKKSLGHFDTSFHSKYSRTLEWKGKNLFQFN